MKPVKDSVPLFHCHLSVLVVKVMIKVAFSSCYLAFVDTWNILYADSHLIGSGNIFPLLFISLATGY